MRGHLYSCISVYGSIFNAGIDLIGLFSVGGYGGLFQ